MIQLSTRNSSYFQNFNDIVPRNDSDFLIDGIDGLQQNEAVVIGVFHEDQKQFDGCFADQWVWGRDQFVEELH